MSFLFSCFSFYFFIIIIKEEQFVTQHGATFTKEEDPIFYYMTVFVTLGAGIVTLRKTFQSE